MWGDGIEIRRTVRTDFFTSPYKEKTPELPPDAVFEEFPTPEHCALFETGDPVRATEL